MSPHARAFWVAEPGRGEIRTVTVPAPGPDDVLVRTLRSGVSRGTEALVFRGGVPPDQYAIMRAPFQDGEFPGPVKYGYLNVGMVEQGPRHLLGRTVFCLYPHQSAYVVPASSVVPVPDGVSIERAVLTGVMETAVNAMWDAAPLIGDRVAVVGGGMVGCCVARLLARIPGAQVTLVDVDPGRARIAAALGVDFAVPADAPGDRDLVVHASASSAGLQLSLDLLATEASVIDLSWYGDTPVTLSLGSAFHSRRLGLRASQVGMIAPARRGSRTTTDRLALALAMLRDPALDCLLTGVSPFAELPSVMARLASGELTALCHSIDYSGAEDWDTDGCDTDERDTGASDTGGTDAGGTHAGGTGPGRSDNDRNIGITSRMGGDSAGGRSDGSRSDGSDRAAVDGEIGIITDDNIHWSTGGSVCSA